MRRKLLRDYQNNGKALELKLEEETPGQYYVSLVGMTVNLRSGCANGTCEGGLGEDPYMFVDNETYIVQPYSDFRQAEEAFNGYKERYLD